MIEYDNSLILRMLDIWNFDITELDVDKIIHVPMHQYRVSTNNKKMLFVENLQCCMGVYAYGDSFGFAAHINPVYMRNDDYEVGTDGSVVRCRRLDDLKNIILDNCSLDEKIKIGVSIGCAPLDREYRSIKMIYDGINELILELNLKGFKVEQLDDLYASEFILNSDNGEIILPRNNKKDIIKRIKLV